MSILQKVTTPIALAIIGFAAFCIAAVTGLTLAGRSVGQVIELITVIIPATIGVVVVASNQKQTIQQNEDIKSSVNGKLDDKLQLLSDKLDYHHAESGARMDAAGIPQLSPIAKTALHKKNTTAPRAPVRKDK